MARGQFTTNGRGRLTAGQFAAYDRRAFRERLQFGEGGVARDVFHTAVGGGDQPLGRDVLERTADAGCNGFRRLRLRVAHADDAENDGLVAEPVEGREIEVRLRCLD